MTIQVQESEESRTVEQTPQTKTTSVIFVVMSDDNDILDENHVLGFIRGFVPAFIDNLPYYGAGVTRLGDQWYNATISYQHQNADSPQDDTALPSKDYSFDTGGGTIHITNGLKTLEKQGKVPKQIGTAINIDEEGKVKGADIPSPVFNFNVTVTLPESQVTSGLIQKIYEGTGGVNDKEFTLFGVKYLARDLLFLGAQGSVTQINDDDVENIWTINYNFSGAKSLVDYKLSDTVTIALKAGWDHLTVLDIIVADKDTGRLVPVAVGAYVTQVYEEIDFADLGAFDD